MQPLQNYDKAKHIDRDIRKEVIDMFAEMEQDMELGIKVTGAVPLAKFQCDDVEIEEMFYDEIKGRLGRAAREESIDYFEAVKEAGVLPKTVKGYAALISHYVAGDAAAKDAVKNESDTEKQVVLTCARLYPETQPPLDAAGIDALLRTGDGEFIADGVLGEFQQLYGRNDHFENFKRIMEKGMAGEISVDQALSAMGQNMEAAAAKTAGIGSLKELVAEAERIKG